MYFDSYEECLRAAIKQSKGQLGDTKLYVKEEAPIYRHVANEWQERYKIGFTPDNPDDAYVYNGLVYSSVKDGGGTIFKCKEAQ